MQAVKEITGYLLKCAFQMSSSSICSRQDQYQEGTQANDGSPSSISNYRSCRLTSLSLPPRYPDLAGYSNYLENVLKNVSTGQTYYDGINEDYNFLTTSQANSSCLTESATSYQVCFLLSFLQTSLTMVCNEALHHRCMCSLAICWLYQCLPAATIAPPAFYPVCCLFGKCDAGRSKSPRRSLSNVHLPAVSTTSTVGLEHAFCRSRH